MPCYDPRSDIEADENRIAVKELRNRNAALEAGLCALISELDKRNLTSEILPEASRKGLIDLIGFWNEHRNEDKVRLQTELHRFSVHEQELLREILNETSKK